ncbi:hypothetical protein VUR80DRAFT_6077 [Thermomyces stellatus]
MRLTPLLRLRQTSSLLETLVIRAPPAPSAATSLPYHVSRTASNNFPVYKRIRAGGSHRSTQVRRVEGDPIRLRDDLRATLDVDADDVIVNPRTRHVIVKGDHMSQIKEFLKQKGF